MTFRSTAISAIEMTSEGNGRFNAQAAAWDSNPDVWTASTSAHQTIQKHFPHMTNYDVLEIGCGTGVLSFMMAPNIHTLTAVDAAEGMIEAFQQKLSKHPDVKNLRAVYALLVDPDDARIQPDPLKPDKSAPSNPRRFDLVISHLVLHHVADLPALFSTMFGCLRSGGSVALTDYEDFGPEARKFHPEDKMDGVERHGLPRKGMEVMLKDAGFVDVKIETAFEMQKGVESVPGGGVKDEQMGFPFLICMGRKP